MKTALALLLAAAAFCAASSLGALAFGSSPAAPAAIVLTASGGGAPAAGKPWSARAAHAVVRRRIEQTRLAAYRARRHKAGR
jgi:hypothetical protein